tara:strand:- start:683 stop:907 length:225 start_codon:yes stop_codon:yes gene_type:complete
LEGKIKPKVMVNTIPPKIDLYADGGDGTTPLIFNRTETNQQYINLTMSDNLDSINILTNEMYRRPVTTNSSGLV